MLRTFEASGGRDPCSTRRVSFCDTPEVQDLTESQHAEARSASRNYESSLIFDMFLRLMTTGCGASPGTAKAPARALQQPKGLPE